MFSHYPKIFIHNLGRQKVITLINISGLALGMAVFILIAQYVMEEYSHEQRWQQADRIVRTNSTLKFNAESSFEMDAIAPRGLDQLQEFFPEQIVTGSRVWRTGQTVVIDEEQIQGAVNYVDPEFLEVFNFETVSGSLTETLLAPGRIALEEEQARTWITGEAMGSSLTVKLENGEERDFVVTAIYRMPAGKGSLEFTSFTLLAEAVLPEFKDAGTHWFGDTDVNTFLLLGAAADADAINLRSKEFVTQHVRLPWVSPDDIVPITERFSFRVQAIRDMYFHPLLGEEGASLLMVNSFALVAALVLLIAITNFVILSVARSAERVREVGVRKANGAVRQQLQVQFLLEALLQVVLAFGLALALHELLQPVFENLMRIELYTQLLSLQLLPWALLLIAGITILGGLYPSFVLAATNPEIALKTGGSKAPGSMVLRKVLVSFQFTIAIGLIIATLVIYQQLSYVQNRDPGFDADRVVSLVLVSEQARNNGTVLMNEIAALEGVDLVTPASRMANILNGSLQVTTFTRERGSGVSSELYAYNVGYDFFSLYSMQLLAGRTFALEQDPLIDRNRLSAEENRAFVTKLVLNETAISAYGFVSAEEAVGATLYAEYRNRDNEVAFTIHEIIGVVADNQFASVRAAPLGETYRLGGTDNSMLSFRVNETAMPTVRSAVEGIWNRVVGTNNATILFGREIMAEEFRQEINENLLLSGFTFMAILVSCMGLYGLVAFDTVKRTKEIGIRKVLGGRHWNIQGLFMQQYFWPMLAANVIAWPAAIWLMQQWLQQFPYQIAQWIIVPICLLASLVVIGIADTTLGLTVRGAYKAKPARALRYE